jgi:heptaprenylglyceryl phosphate synthase
MAEYLVIFNAAPVASSDAALGTAPIASTKILAPVATAKVVYVEASSVANAQKAVEAAYTVDSGMAQKPLAGTEFSGNAPIVVATASLKES